MDAVGAPSMGAKSFDLKNGSTPTGGFFEEKGIPYFRSQDFDLFDFEINQYIKKEFHDKLNRSAIKPKDVLLAVVGATLGVVGYVPDDIKEGNINQNVVRIRVKDKEVNPKFLAIILSSKTGQTLIIRNSTIQTQAYINNSQLGNIRLPISSLEVQNKIVALMDNAYNQKKQKESEAQQLLDSIDDYVLDELGIKLPELKDEMTYIVNSDTVEHKRIDAYYYQPKFEEVEKAIKNGKFEVMELKEFITKIHYGASVKNEYVNEGIPLLRIQNLKENKVDLRDVVKLPETMKKEIGTAFVNEGDLLISRSGTVGVVSVVPKEADGFAFGSFMIKFCLNDKINKYYVSIWLNSRLQKLLTEREKIGAIQGNITIGTIESFKIPLPPLAVQNKIADEVKNRMQKAEQLQESAKEELEKAKQEVEKIVLGE
ncbi:MAG: restriction endonuclease subunit S [Candidatus Stahlbacteria bacterium]|nr:restriction endonuclease subunit S [Candidatus Stahlbacteria bacterium]